MEWNLRSADNVGFYIHSQGSLVLETLEKSPNVQLTVKVNFKYSDREIQFAHDMDERVSQLGDRKNAPQDIGSSQDQRHEDMNMLVLSRKRNCPFPGGIVGGGNDGTCG